MVFGSLLKGGNGGAVHLGSPEAEAESLPTSNVKLWDVYEDFHRLAEQLHTQKFILIGRKGSGKSAFAEYVCSLASTSATEHAKFIKAGEVHIQQALQLGAASGSGVSEESFFEWLVFTNLLRLFLGNEAIQSDREFEKLRQFLNKNSGYIDIRELEIKELIEKNGFEVSTDYLTRFIKGKLNKNVETKSGRAPYYKLIPHLEEVIVTCMKSSVEKANGNEYVLFFDDLDILFSTTGKHTSDSIVALLRACKRINNDVFAKNSIAAKVVVLLRDDIETFISSSYPDTAKLFSSYSTRISWYQDDYSRNRKNEDNLYLKRMICKRIVHAQNAGELTKDASHVWDSLVKPQPGKRVTTFEYILNQTLFRPRDLILFFKPLENGGWVTPLSIFNLKQLAAVYHQELVKELYNELSSFYTKNDIDLMFDALANICKTTEPVEYIDAKDALAKVIKHIDASSVIEHLFDRSIIGIADNNYHYFFKCRHMLGSGKPLQLDPAKKIVVQYGIAAYLRNKYHGRN